MAKSNFIETKKAIDDITLAIDKQINSANELNSKVIALNSNYAKLPSEYVKTVNEIAVVNQKVVKSENDVNLAIKKKLKVLEEETRNRQALNRQREASLRQLEREEAKLNASQSLYNKVQAKLNALSNEYKQLAVQKELTGRLTDAESKRYDFLAGKITKYDTTLKAVDASMGKYQRNVGNYASAFNPLGNSINQLTREMPAFANSVQTGFMAISNNLPIFFDAISGIKKANADLRAEGKPTQSVLSQLATSLFSWGTALSVAVTLLTIYGKDIVEFAGSLIKSVKAIDTLKESQKQLNEISKQGQKNAVEETLNLKSLLAIAKDASLTYKERMVAVKELQDTYPAYLGNLSKEKILAGETTQAEKELTNAILSRAKANASIEKITENQSKIIDLEEKRIEVQKRLAQAEKDVNTARQTQSQTTGGGTVAGTYDLETTALTRLTRAKSQLKNIDVEIKDLNAINNRLSTYAIERQKEAILLDYKEEKVKKDKVNTKREDIKAIDLTISKTKGLLETLEDNKKSMIELQKQTSNSRKEWAFYQERIDMVQKAIDYLTKGNTDLEDSAKKATDEFQKLHFPTQPAEELKKVSQYLQSFIDDFASSAGLTGTFDILQGRIDGFGEDFQTTFVAIAESAQEAFNFITKNMGDNFAEQYAMLEKQKETELLFAGDTASAKANIESQYEERKRQIANKEAQAKKKQALFNIAIDTAQAVVSALPNIPLSVTIGLIGLAQLALVNSQEVPQFWTGTDNAPEGLALTQERGREIITDKQGNIKSMGSNKGAQLTYLNKGDKVFNADKTMDLLMFNDNLNSILTDNGISSPKIEVNNSGISDDQVNRIVNSINNKESLILNYDGLDLIMKRKKANEVIENMNRRINFVGKSI